MIVHSFTIQNGDVSLDGDLRADDTPKDCQTARCEWSCAMARQGRLGRLGSTPKEKVGSDVQFMRRFHMFHYGFLWFDLIFYGLVWFYYGLLWFYYVFTMVYYGCPMVL